VAGVQSTGRAELTGNALRRRTQRVAQPPWLGYPLGQEHADRGDRLLVLAEDRRRDGHQRVRVHPAVDGQPLAAHLGERAPHHLRRDQVMVRLTVQRQGQHLLLHLDRRERQQGQPHAGAVHRHLAADAVEHGDGTVRGEPFHQGDLKPLADGELHVLLRHRGEVAHERQGDLPQAVPARRERGDLEQPQSDRVAPFLVALERAPGEQPPGQPQRRAHRDSAPPAQLAQRQPAMTRVKGREQCERPVDDRLALRRALAANPRDRISRSRHLVPPLRTRRSSPSRRSPQSRSIEWHHS
jgi:hypothetical protein